MKALVVAQSSTMRLLVAHWLKTEAKNAYGVDCTCFGVPALHVVGSMMSHFNGLVVDEECANNCEQELMQLQKRALMVPVAVVDFGALHSAFWSPDVVLRRGPQLAGGIRRFTAHMWNEQEMRQALSQTG